mmetsp:Transcript_9145/g.27518  ORF Transcript_9145/g.27518 Transcript_9145/m.27518 type:complete len:211 (+) Transcript_9145:2271-2903(+)
MREEPRRICERRHKVVQNRFELISCSVRTEVHRPDFNLLSKVAKPLNFFPGQTVCRGARHKPILFHLLEQHFLGMMTCRCLQQFHLFDEEIPDIFLQVVSKPLAKPLSDPLILTTRSFHVIPFKCPQQQHGSPKSKIVDHFRCLYHLSPVFELRLRLCSLLPCLSLAGSHHDQVFQLRSKLGAPVERVPQMFAVQQKRVRLYSLRMSISS